MNSSSVMPDWCCRIPLDARFHSHLAQLLLTRFGDRLADCDLVLPNLKLLAPLRAALMQIHDGPLLMPRVFSLASLAERALAQVRFEYPSQRMLRLVAQLRQRPWLSEVDLWSVASELASVADELIERRAPDAAEALERVLRDSHGLDTSAALSLEARLIHAVWSAESGGLPGLARARREALMTHARQSARPLIHVADGELGEWEQAWLACHDSCYPGLTLGVVPALSLSSQPLARFLISVWPDDVQRPLFERLQRVELPHEFGQVGKLRLVSATTLEQEARLAADTVLHWLAGGKRDIAVIAMDREAARRTRALLEREQVLLADETGWKLSTTRAAALVEAWHQLKASDGYHRDLLDLLKSPFVAPWSDLDARAAAVGELERWMAQHNHVEGLAALLRDAATVGDTPVRRMVDVLRAADEAMPVADAPPARWLQRLREVLLALQADEALAGDSAGADLLALLGRLQQEVGDSALKMNFAEWRQWLNAEMEQAVFRDTSIDSPLVLTALPATRLRRFDAALIVGADRERLRPELPRGLLAHTRTREELGLPGLAQARARLRDDLASLVMHAGELVLTWQSQREGEPNLPAVDIDLLALAIRHCGGPECRSQAPETAVEPAADLPPLNSAPTLPAGLVAQRISASAYEDLLRCPYRYYAARVLGLGALDEVDEALEKRDVGVLLHGVLLGFHRAHPRLLDHDPAALQHALQQASDTAFAPAIVRNPMELAWAASWSARIPAYLHWALERERQGWMFHEGEAARRLVLTLPGARTLALEGRLDRIDAAGEALGLIDYKLRNVRKLTQQLACGDEDVQLAFYSLLGGPAVGRAAYLALDGETIGEVELEDCQAAAQRQALRLGEVFAALYEGAPLPAHGSEQACTYCEMGGLCRRAWQ